MNRTTSYSILILVAGIVLSLSVPAAKAQTAIKALNDDPGIDCLDYKLDALTLVDYHHQIYWKQHDCIRVHVKCNPFLFKCAIKFGENLIPEDDPVGSLGGKFGLNVSGVSNSGGTPAEKKKDALDIRKAQTQPLGDAMAELTKRVVAATADPKNSALRSTEPFLFRYSAKFNETPIKEGEPLSFPAIQPDASGLQEVERQIRLVKDPAVKASLQDALKQVNNALNPPPPTPKELSDWKQAAKDLKDASDLIKDGLARKTSEYDVFSGGVPTTLTKLRDTRASLEDVRTQATNLRDDAASKLADMAKSEPEHGKAGALTFEEQMVNFAKSAAKLHSALLKKEPSGDGTAAELLEEVHTDAETVAHSACTYKAKEENDFSSLRAHLLDPLNKVLDHPLAFEYEGAALRREGGWADPEQVTMTVTREDVFPFTTMPDDPKKAANTTSSFACSSDASDLFANGADYKIFDDFFSDKELKKDAPNAAPNTYTRNQLKPVPVPMTPAPTATNATEKKPATPDPDPTLRQQWFFGKARLVVSGGLSSGFLAKQEFQRSSSITGTGSNATSSTVIGLKTDTRFRLTPMLYAHTLLYSRRHDPDAWYATFGVTANSDSKGTDPEFLLGFSRSLVQQRCFFTLGAYIGERQKLDGGLHVGDTIPSTLTGELPVTKSYHVGWGFGLSYRFTSTKDPQKDSSAPAKQPAK